MKIGLFGAAFDPPHRGHQKIILDLIQKKWVDQVWVVPVKDHPFHKKMTADEQRLEMVRIMINEVYKSGISVNQVRLETFELEQTGPSYSFQTLTNLSRHYPQHTFCWIMGADNVASFHRWNEYQALLQQFPVLVFPRPGFEHPTVLPGMTMITHVEPIDISSTKARAALAEGQSGLDLVLPEIAEYSKAHLLYVTPPPKPETNA